mmetsp:Transcript_27442/g.89831  ORF Transcript_27442/g.89831 Transcript_27442/m.89831 type:complete len:719 (-) Transcript_27442:138-2294(-)
MSPLFCSSPAPRPSSQGREGRFRGGGRDERRALVGDFAPARGARAPARAERSGDGGRRVRSLALDRDGVELLLADAEALVAAALARERVDDDVERVVNHEHLHRHPEDGHEGVERHLAALLVRFGFEKEVGDEGGAHEADPKVEDGEDVAPVEGALVVALAVRLVGGGEPHRAAHVHHFERLEHARDVGEEARDEAPAPHERHAPRADDDGPNAERVVDEAEKVAEPANLVVAAEDRLVLVLLREARHNLHPVLHDEDVEHREHGDDAERQERHDGERAEHPKGHLADERHVGTPDVFEEYHLEGADAPARALLDGVHRRDRRHAFREARVHVARLPPRHVELERRVQILGERPVREAVVRKRLERRAPQHRVGADEGHAAVVVEPAHHAVVPHRLVVVHVVALRDVAEHLRRLHARNLVVLEAALLGHKGVKHRDGALQKLGASHHVGVEDGDKLAVHALRLDGVVEVARLGVVRLAGHLGARDVLDLVVVVLRRERLANFLDEVALAVVADVDPQLVLRVVEQHRRLHRRVHDVLRLVVGGDEHRHRRPVPLREHPGDLLQPRDAALRVVARPALVRRHKIKEIHRNLAHEKEDGWVSLPKRPEAEEHVPRLHKAEQPDVVAEGVLLRQQRRLHALRQQEALVVRLEIRVELHVLRCGQAPAEHRLLPAHALPQTLQQSPLVLALLLLRGTAQLAHLEPHRVAARRARVLLVQRPR